MMKLNGDIMKNLIDIKQENLIECDNKQCDYVVKNESKDPNERIDKFINTPCPKCGQNLLTEEDYMTWVKLMNKINWINKWFSWLTIFTSKKNKVKSTVKVYNGVHVKDKK